MSAVRGGSAVSSNVAARRSSPAFKNQERTSAIRSGSCGMKEPTLPDDRRRKRGRKVKSAIEAASGPHQHVHRSPGAPKALVGQLAPLPLGSCIVGNHQKEVVVAVRA